MNEITILVVWLIAAALTLFAGSALLLVVAIVYTSEDDRRLMERSAWGCRKESGRQGCNHRSEVDGPDSLHIFQGRRT